MRLGFDLDGTVADLHSALAQEARRLFPDIDPNAVPSSAAAAPAPGAPAGGEGQPAGPAADDQRMSIGALNARQQREMWNAVCARENFWESLNEIEPGSLARLYRLVKEKRWELIFLTSRPETKGDRAQEQSYRWLKARGYETPSVFVVQGSRGKIASALQLDVLVDDRPENCLDVAIDSSARAILVWRGDEGKVPASARQLGIGSVSSIHECLNILEELDSPDDSQPTMIDRLKRLLGLKPAASKSRDAGRAGQPSRPGAGATTAR